MIQRRTLIALSAASALTSLAPSVFAHQAISLLNVSYDPTRELYVEYNAAFAKHWKAKTGQVVTLNNRMAVLASRRDRSLAGWMLTWPRWRWLAPTTRWLKTVAG